MSNKSHSGDSAQLNLFDILKLAENLDSKYSSKEIGEVIGKLRAAKRTAESTRKMNVGAEKKKNRIVKPVKKKREKKHISAKLPVWIFLWTGIIYSIPMYEHRGFT